MNKKQRASFREKVIRQSPFLEMADRIRSLPKFKTADVDDLIADKMEDFVKEYASVDQFNRWRRIMLRIEYGA